MDRKYVPDALDLRVKKINLKGQRLDEASVSVRARSNSISKSVREIEANNRLLRPTQNSTSKQNARPAGVMSFMKSAFGFGSKPQQERERAPSIRASTMQRAPSIKPANTTLGTAPNLRIAQKMDASRSMSIRNRSMSSDDRNLPNLPLKRNDDDDNESVFAVLSRTRGNRLRF